MDVIKLSSEEARLADRRVRIVRDETPEKPSKSMDLVFKEAEDEESIPKDAIWKLRFDRNFESAPMWFFTTEDRCRKLVSPDPGKWSKEALAQFEKEEHRLWQDWWDGNVFGWILEKWDPARREFVHEESCWGYYGVPEILRAVQEDVLDFAEEPGPGEKDMIVCAEDDLVSDFA